MHCRSMARPMKIWSGSMSSVVGITRVRNESEIIRDTLDHFAQWCDGGIIVYDDCSTDNTVEIAHAHPSTQIGRAEYGDGVIEQFEPWQPDRTREEYRHRQILLEAARVRNPQWIIYFDADERLEWDGVLPEDPAVDALYFDLYDAYIVSDDVLENWWTRKMFGPEYREIVFAYRNLPSMRYHLRDQRIVSGYKHAVRAGRCKHYGKAISTEQWEATCDYYIRYFPEPYKTKWRERKGKAIHELSDFARPLYSWADAEKNKICIGKLPW
jgi:glycosyltransferase involved in cell wall biosynthesis